MQERGRKVDFPNLESGQISVQTINEALGDGAENALSSVEEAEGLRMLSDTGYFNNVSDSSCLVPTPKLIDIECIWKVL